MQSGQTIRDYILEAKIGLGGMGEVWRSRHTLLDKLVAIKVISDELLSDPEFETRFLQEAKAQARLYHPHIVPVTEFFREANRYHLVMPLVEGPSLAARLATSRGPLPLEEALRIAQDVLSALDYAHQQGVIHRDVKPSNILIDHTGHAYLMDFGIALVMNEERRTRTGKSVGTPHYMSPEQIQHPKQLDHRTDVYSFGCVLYEMLAGRAPFDATSEEGDVDYLIKAAHVHQAPEPMRKWNENVPEAIEAVARRALQKNPAERFAGCGEFGRALAKATRAKTESESSLPLTSPQPAPSRPEPASLTPFRGFTRIALFALIGMLIGAALMVTVFLIVSIFNGPPGSSEMGEIALGLLFGGMLPGAVIGGISSAIQRLKYRILSGAICHVVIMVTYAIADGAKDEGLLIAAAIGAVLGMILGATIKMIARRFSQRLKD